MSLNISTLLNSLKGFYDNQKQTGQKLGTNSQNISELVSCYGMSGTNDVELKEDSLSKEIGFAEKVTITSAFAQKFSYKEDEATGKLIIFGSNLTIDIPSGFERYVEVVGISNTINSNDDDDSITLFGYGNKVNTDEGKDTVAVFGEDNEINNAEVIKIEDKENIFASVSGISVSDINVPDAKGTVVIKKTDDNEPVEINLDGKKYKVKINTSLEKIPEKGVEVSYELNKTTGEITFKGDGFYLIADDEQIDLITLEGKNCILETGDKNDVINVKGDNNIIHSGEGADEINVDGKTNEIYADKGEDNVNVKGESNIIDAEIATYKETKGNILLTPEESTSHYIEVEIGDVTYKYLVQRNDSTESAGKNIEISYEIKDGILTVTGDNVKVISQTDGFDDNVSLIGNNIYLDTGDGNDTVSVKGNKSSIVTGDGIDEVTINGDENKITGDASDNAIVQSGKNNSFDLKNVTYTSESGAITLKADEDTQHYLTVGGFSYLIQRNTESRDDVVLSYKFDSEGKLEIEGDNFKIIAQNDGVNDNIKVKGNNNYIDTGDGDDIIEAEGNKNVIMAGDGDDEIAAFGDNNEIQGGEGNDKLALSGKNNITDGIENIQHAIRLTDTNQAETVEIDGKKYTFERTKAGEQKEAVNIICESKDGKVFIKADDVVLIAGNGQTDNIMFEGSNSEIFAMDKDDNIEVKGNNNFIDGWTGNDKISAEGMNNKVYGFMGDDEINIVQTDNTESEIIAEKENVSKTDKDGKTRTDDEIYNIAKENLLKANANIVDGEFDTDTVNATKYTNVLTTTEVYKSLAQSVKIEPDESEKKIVVDGRSYTIKNHVTKDNNNPFVSTRTISYEIVDVEIDGEMQKQLVVKGDFISVVADDNQNDNVKLIGNNSYLDLGNDDDYLEAEGNFNQVFGGIGADYLKVKGSNNQVQGDFYNKTDVNDDDVIEVTGDKNTINGGDGHDVLRASGENNSWNGIEVVEKATLQGEKLTDKVREVKLNANDGKVYTVKINIDDDKEVKEDVNFTYSIVDGVLTIKGDKLHVIANPNQKDSVRLLGNDCVIELGDEDDTVDVNGSRNVVKAGEGNDKITLYGDNITAYGDEGDDEFTVNTVSSKIYGGQGTNKLNITSERSNTYEGFDSKNITKQADKGVVVLTAEKSVDTITYLDSNGIPISLKVTLNLDPEQKFAGTKYVDYEVVEVDVNGKRERQIVISGNSISVNMTDANRDNAVCAKIVGSDIRFESFNGDDYIEVEGIKNKVLTGDGQNTVNVKGDNNTVVGSKNIDTFNVKGNENVIIGSGEKDKVSFEGLNNQFKTTASDAKKGGSVLLTNEIGPQTIIIDNKAYQVSIYGIDKKDLPNVKINVEYMLDSNGELTFMCDNVMIRSLDEEEDINSPEGISGSRDYLKIIGNNCYVFAGFASDTIKVEGDNNILDGWYGDDSFDVVGNNNEIRGFDGDDVITITKGDNNTVNGEEGNDTLTIIEGTGNTYKNVEKVIKK